MKKILLNAPSKLSRFYIRTLSVLFLIIGVSTAAYSQAGTLQGNYTYAESVNPANYVAITGGTQLSTGAFANNPLYTVVTLPFTTFYYNNTAVTQINISENGFIYLGNTNLPATPNTMTTPITDANTYTGAIACYGFDIRSATGTGVTSEIRYETIGSVGTRTFVVQYKDVRRAGDTSTFGLMNMQIRLNEVDNSIEVIYKENFVSAFLGAINGQVGLRGASSADYYNRAKVLTNIAATSLVAGQTYKITAVGTTNFVAIGATSNTVGVYFTATGVGSGTGTANCAFWPGPDGTSLGASNADILVTSGIPVAINVNNSTYFITGQQYKIVSIGTTDFTLIGAASNTVGLNFVATALGSGTGTVNLTSQLVTAGSFVVGKAYQITTVGTTNFTLIGASASAVGTNFIATGVGLGTGIASLHTALAGYQAGTKMVWSPCFKPTGITAVLQADISKVDISWTAPNYIGSGTYDYEVRTSGAPGSGATGLFASGTQAGTSVTVSGLVPGTTYSIYVKRSCSSTWLPVSTFPSSVTVTPSCSNATIPYTQNFQIGTYTVPAIPNCNTVINSNNSFPNVTRDNTSTPYYGFNSKNFITTNASANDEWFFTQAITVPAGSYRLSYTYGGTRQLSFLEQKMKVYYSTDVTNALGTKVLLADHSSIKDSPLTNVINFTVATAGTYYIAFNCYAASSQGALQLDDIVLAVSTCSRPTGLTSAQITSNSAIISWGTVASASSGYDYYYTPATGATFTSGSFVAGQTYQIVSIGTTDFTTNGAASNTVGLVFTATGVGSATTGTAKLITAPASTVVPSGSVASGNIIANLSSLTPSTNYNFWVRSNCGGGDVGEWSAGGAFTTPAVVTYCSPSGATFAQDLNGITNVTMGSINYTSGLETNNYGNYSATQITNVSQTATVPVSITYQTGFTYDTTIWVDWNNDGDFLDAGEIVYTGVSSSSLPAILSASFVVPALDSGGVSTLGPRRIRIGGIDYGPTNGSPIDDNPFSDACRNGRYQVFEDYTLYIVTAPPAVTLSASSVVMCEGAAILPTVTVTVAGGTGSYQVYNWSPSTGVTGTIGGGYTFNPTATTTYILTATQPSGNFSSTSASYAITVNPLPSAIVVTPSTATTCQNGGSAQALVATGGIITGVEVFNEKFNGGTTTNTAIYDSTGTLTGTSTFTTVNNSTGTSPAASVWTLTNLTNTTNEFIRSNDATQFYLSDSDQQGSGGLTNTELISPAFSLVGFSDATLSFWHYYNALGGSAEVQISTDGGTTYTLLPGFSYTTDQGTATSFKNVVVSLTSYVGQANLKIKFKYINAPYAWWWAIDNVKVAGAATSNVVWAPTTGLFTNAAATVAYTGTPALTVYAKPSASTVYTASATTTLGSCTRTSNTATITVTPLAGGATSPDQAICANLASDITLTGSSGSIQWYSATNLAFTTGVTLIPTATTTTLTSALMGVLTANSYYRATVTNGTCTTYSNIASVTISKVIWSSGAWSNVTGPTSAIGAEFQGNFTSSINASATLGNLSACSVTVTSGTVLFDRGTLTVENAVIVSGGSLTFDDALYDVSLYQPNAVTNGAGVYSGGNSGNISFKRTAKAMYKFDYTYWSSPVYPQNLLAVSPGSPTGLFLSYNNGWQYVASPGTTTMAAGKGYAIRAPTNFPVSPSGPDPYTAPFLGIPNNGTFSVAVIGGAGQLNLFGNPYPSALLASSFVSANPSINGSLYFWTHNTPISAGQYATNDYAIWNASGAIRSAAGSLSGVSVGITPSGNIASGQGFFVEGLSNGTATYTNAMRIAGNNAQFFKATSTHQAASSLERNRYWLNITNTEGAFKEALIAYIETATLGVDRLFDAKVADAGNVISLYTKVDATRLSIQGRPLPFDVYDTVPLNYKSTIASIYTITMPEYDGLFTTQHVYLEDTLLQIIHDLTESPYSFATEVGTFENRFVLRYTTEALGISTPVFNENTVVVYKNNQGLFITTGTEPMATVTIYDIRGRELASKKQINNTTTVFTTLPTTQQVLLVRIEGEHGAVVTKKVVY